MVLLIIIEILLLVGSMFWGSLISHLEQNEKDIFKERVINRKNYLEREMISNWSNITDTAQTINEITASMIETGEISIKTLDQGSEFCESLVLKISEDLIS